jgi:hypothetical protein
VVLQAILYNIAIMSMWSIVATMTTITVLAGVSVKPLHAPVQAVSHIVYGKQAHETNDTNLTFIVVGFLLNAFAMIMWSGVAEFSIRAFGMPPGNLGVALLVAAGVTVTAFIVDFHVVPKRFTPGFEHILDRRALFIVYFFLGASLFLGAMGRVA